MAEFLRAEGVFFSFFFGVGRKIRSAFRLYQSRVGALLLLHHGKRLRYEIHLFSGRRAGGHRFFCCCAVTLTCVLRGGERFGSRLCYRLFLNR